MGPILKIEGEWLNSNLNGEAILNLFNGEKQVCVYKKGVRKGPFYIYKPNGKLF